VDASDRDAGVNSKLIASGGFDVLVYDSIEQCPAAKQELVKTKPLTISQLWSLYQAGGTCACARCVPCYLNHIRDATAGRYVIEKSPGGPCWNHLPLFASILKSPKGVEEGQHR